MPARLNDREYDRLMNEPKVREAMRFRCEEQGHDFVGAAAFTMSGMCVWQQCQWCDENR